MPVSVITGDCRDILAAMPPALFDCGITDPTYEETNLEWDRSVDGWIEAVSRSLKPHASLWVFGSFRSLSHLVVPEMREHGWKFAQDYIWKKQNGTGFQTDRFRRVHELAVQFYRGSWRDVYTDTQYTMDARAKVVRRKNRPAHTGDIGRGHYVSVDGGPRMMTSVAEVRNEHSRAIHPTQKPVELLLPLVRYSCPPHGDAARLLRRQRINGDRLAYSRPRRSAYLEGSQHGGQGTRAPRLLGIRGGVR